MGSLKPSSATSKPNETYNLRAISVTPWFRGSKPGASMVAHGDDGGVTNMSNVSYRVSKWLISGLNSTAEYEPAERESNQRASQHIRRPVHPDVDA